LTRALHSHFARFLMIGAAGTALHFAVLAVGVKWVRLDAVSASQCGALAGAWLNYILNRRFNYASSASHSATLPRFASVAASGFVLNGLLMALFVVHWELDVFLGQCFSTALVLLWNFLLNHYWTFRVRIRSDGGPR
jgi:putative flippase GtrA